MPAVPTMSPASTARTASSTPAMPTTPIFQLDAVGAVLVGHERVGRDDPNAGHPHQALGPLDGLDCDGKGHAVHSTLCPMARVQWRD
jgi:hypothetical protein